MGLFIHLVFHNYGLERAAVVSNALSLNDAIFASVCLASRLASSYDAFVLLTFSVVAFVLFPIFRFRLNGLMLLYVAFFFCVVFSHDNCHILHILGGSICCFGLCYGGWYFPLPFCPMAKFQAYYPSPPMG